MVAGSASGYCDGQILRRCGCLGGGGVKFNGGGWESRTMIFYRAHT